MATAYRLEHLFEVLPLKVKLNTATKLCIHAATVMMSKLEQVLQVPATEGKTYHCQQTSYSNGYRLDIGIWTAHLCPTAEAEPEIANEKKEEISRGVWGHNPPLPPKILKVETKICAIWGILWANLKKCSTLKFMTNISFVPAVCFQRSITLIFIEKKVCFLIFFSTEKIFFCDFRLSFPREPLFPQRIPGSEKVKLNTASKLHTQEATGLNIITWTGLPSPVTEGNAQHCRQASNSSS